MATIAILPPRERRSEKTHEPSTPPGGDRMGKEALGKNIARYILSMDANVYRSHDGSTYSTPCQYPELISTHSIRGPHTYLPLKMAQSKKQGRRREMPAHELAPKKLYANEGNKAAISATILTPLATVKLRHYARGLILIHRRWPTTPTGHPFSSVHHCWWINSLVVPSSSRNPNFIRFSECSGHWWQHPYYRQGCRRTSRGNRPGGDNYFPYNSMVEDD